jgi:GT2 family glycosyltransferase
MNAGVALLADGHYERVFFLNNDTLLATDTLGELVKHVAMNPDELITGLKVLGDNGKVKTFGGYRYYPWLGIARAVKKSYRQPGFRGLDYIDGAAFLIAGDFLRRIGGLPETNFLYFEELNLAAQMPDKSRLGCCPTASAVHQGGVTTQGELPAPSRHYHALLSCLRYTEQYESRWQLPSVLATRLGWLLLLSIKTRSLAPISGGVGAVQTFFYKR